MPDYRFDVALSFPGEHRRRVKKIAELLAVRLGRDKVLYDKFFEAEFARPNLNVYLPKLYLQSAYLYSSIAPSMPGRNGRAWSGEWASIL